MRASFVCDPGAPRGGRYNEEQLAEKCKCGDVRAEHWWGEGPCTCGKCDYFDAKRKAER